jgi:hypothetical protein
VLHYKFVELSTVTDESMELAVNECVALGWNFDGVHFAMAVGSKRPAMAFLTFTRDKMADETAQEASGAPTD